jgi:hypothetical protein
MTPQQQEHEEWHACLMAIQHALTAQEREQFMDSAIRRWPMFESEGYTPADVLDYTTGYDEFLAQTEPFFAGPGRPDLNAFPKSPAVVMAAHAVILLGRPLAPGYVADILTRAGVMDGCPDGGACHHECAASASAACFRVQCAGPLSWAGFEHNRWPDDIRVRNGMAPAPVSYDPSADLAVVLVAAAEANYRARTSPALAGALARLRERVNVSSPEQAEIFIRDLYGKRAADPEPGADPQALAAATRSAAQLRTALLGFAQSVANLSSRPVLSDLANEILASCGEGK